MNAKKILLKKAIREEFTLVMSHDQRDLVVEIKGEPDQPNFERVF
jgi:tRNA U54 and U55 pseudouridine synthase Pus10